MTLADLFMVAAGAIWVYITLVWLLSLVVKDSSIVDIFWGPGFVVVGGITLQAVDTVGIRPWLIFSLIVVWGLRLALHIGIRNMGQPEDPRYANWRRQSGSNWWWYSYLKVFLLQGTVMWIVSAPLVFAIHGTSPPALTVFDWSGILIFSFGFLFESIGDEQLRRFKSDLSNKGKVMDTGLWRYTRHPNYFGESVLWWGLFLMACSVAGGWVTIFSPILMTWLLLRVSGVTMLEKSMKQSRPGYQEYIQRTSAFVPRPPRRLD